MSDREGYLKRRDQLLMQDERIAELEAENAKLREAAQAVVDARHADLIRADGLLPTTAQSKAIDALREIAESTHLGNSWARHKAKEALEEGE